MPEISMEQLGKLAEQLRPLTGIQFQILRIPRGTLASFEPSQVGTIVGTLIDACIPDLPALFPNHEGLAGVGLTKHPGLLGDREGYPDFQHGSGVRVELKLLYVDPADVVMKKPPTPREPSARITQKVTEKNVDPERDALLLLAYQLKPCPENPELFSPTVINLGLFPMIQCVRARDARLLSGGGRWFGDYETPAVLSRIGQGKRDSGELPDVTAYGRKESEGKDFNEDTNFGKLKRIPYEPLQRFLKDHGASYARSGTYPAPWQIAD